MAKKQDDSRLQRAINAAERNIIKEALAKHDGHQTNTAAWLGVSRRTLYDKMRHYGLEGDAAAMRTVAGIVGPRGDRQGE